MIERHTSHRQSSEWFLANRDDIAPLIIHATPSADHLSVFVPGVSRLPRTTGRFQIHRSHLPLLTVPSAFKFTGYKVFNWLERDRRLADRHITLRTTQQQAIDYMDPRRGTLLGDDMRLGKTLASLMCHDPARGPLVVVAPKSTRAVWLGWMRRLWPETPIGVAVGKALSKEVLEKRLIFIHYEIAAQWQALFKIGTLILDEAHYLTNKDSKRSKACVLLASRAEKIIAATGTPIYTHPIDLWNVLGTIAPGAWGDPYSFGWRYCDPQTTAYGTTYDGVTNEAELKARLSEVMIRRIWKDCKNDLPPISRSITVAEVDPRTRKRLDVLAAKLRTERTNAAANLAIYRRQLSEIKLSTTINEALKIFASGEPQVVWTWHKDLADAITLRLIEKGIPTFKIHGDIPSDRRDLLIDAWRSVSNGALIATMAVAQVGIDLSHAHLGTFAELDYTPLVIAQAEMRTFDATRPMSINFIVADHIVDQRMIRSLIGKLSASDPLGLGSAIDAITAIRSMLEGPGDEPDMQRFLDDLLESGIE